tara:strand:+ start:246 stop:383 length:138 start_codon:yes stop_codon:yes gene_type:complete
MRPSYIDSGKFGALSNGHAQNAPIDGVDSAIGEISVAQAEEDALF